VLEKSGDVLDEYERGLALANDPDELRPERALVGVPFALARARVRLAGDARHDEIHASTPRASVEGGEIIPERRAIQGRVLHPRHKDSRCVGVPLNITSGAVFQSEAMKSSGDAEVESADPRAEGEGTYSHDITQCPSA
jgi:hypothetical protein